MLLAFANFQFVIRIKETVMGSKLNFTDQENFYRQLLELEAKKEAYDVDTGITEVKNLPLRLLHHIGIS